MHHARKRLNYFSPKHAKNAKKTKALDKRGSVNTARVVRRMPGHWGIGGLAVIEAGEAVQSVDYPQG